MLSENVELKSLLESCEKELNRIYEEESDSSHFKKNFFSKSKESLKNGIQSSGDSLKEVLRELQKSIKTPQISLSLVSPTLFQHRFSKLTLSSHSIISFNDNVSILSTKTRPKKLTIQTTDGKSLPFLLKGISLIISFTNLIHLFHFACFSI